MTRILHIPPKPAKALRTPTEVLLLDQRHPLVGKVKQTNFHHVQPSQNEEGMMEGRLKGDSRKC